MCGKAKGAGSACGASSNKTELSETAFRIAEKKYKLFRLDARASRRQTVEESDFSDVIDFHNFEANTVANRQMMRLVSEIVIGAATNATDSDDNAKPRAESAASSSSVSSESDPKKIRTEKVHPSPASASASAESATTAKRTQRCYTFDGVPGLLFFPAALSPSEQQYWCSQALDEYAKSPPYPNNLTTLDKDLVTTRYGGPHRRQTVEDKADGAVTVAASLAAVSGDSSSSSPPSQGNATKKGTQKQQQQSPPAAKERMRWATLGFKYNWTTKSYDPSEYCRFPTDLSRMIKATFFSMLAPVAARSLQGGDSSDEIEGTSSSSNDEQRRRRRDAEAVALATAKAVELAKGLQQPMCKFAAAAAAGSAASAAVEDEMVSVGGMLVPRSELPSSTACAASGGASAAATSASVTRNPNNLPAAAPITLLANAVAASHKAISDDEILAALLSPTYEPQTAIVNFFPLGSMMCAHQDLSEPCLHRPLISVSLGSSCVFLMGSTSREDTPHAFLLRSGDIVAFTGPSRVAFHAVPRVMEDCPAHLIAFDERMRNLRININVRQVYDEPQPQLVDDDEGGALAPTI